MGEGLFQPTHLLLIMAIALMIMGPGKLGEVGSALGRSVREFRHAATGAPESPKPLAASHCPSCGQDVQSGSRFCASCGTPLNS